MDTIATQKLYTPTNDFDPQLIFNHLHSFEQIFSSYNTNSSLYKLNLNPTEPCTLSPELYSLLKRTVEFSKLSNGIFDPTIFPLTSLWTTARDLNSPPSQLAIDNAKKLVNYQNISFLDNNTITLLQNMGIDLGGIAKGEALNQSREIYRQNNIDCAVLSLGGNVLVHGEKSDNSPFSIGIRDPKGSANDILGIVELSNKIVSTSGGYERFFDYNGITYHHIINPATGYPSNSDLLSVTVIDYDGVVADFYSSYLFMLGLDKTLEVINASNLSIIAVSKDNTVHLSDNIKSNFTLTNHSVYSLSD